MRALLVDYEMFLTVYGNLELFAGWSKCFRSNIWQHKRGRLLSLSVVSEDVWNVYSQPCVLLAHSHYKTNHVKRDS